MASFRAARWGTGPVPASGFAPVILILRAAIYVTPQLGHPAWLPALVLRVQLLGGVHYPNM